MTTPANYSTLHLPQSFHGNPFCEALPALPDMKGLMSALVRRPAGDFSARDQADVARFMEVSSLLDTNFPRQESLLLAMRCLSMLLNSYSRNHPLSTDTLRRLYDISGDAFGSAASLPLQVDASSVLGWSGMGKTTMIRCVLKLFPQVIQHECYQGQEFSRKQVVYLSVDAPVAASPKGLILNIASALDQALGLAGPGSHVSQYQGSRLSVESQRVLITRALASSGVGLLHIDDLQRLGEGSRTHRDAVSAMIIGIANTAGCSLLFSGTLDALGVLQSNFEVARRANRRGSFLLKPPRDDEAEFFTTLVTFLFRYQLVRQPVAPTLELGRHLLNLSAGIPGVLVMLYVAAQETAVVTGRPLDAELFSDVMRDQFGTLQAPIRKLNRMRKGGVLKWSSGLDQAIGQRLARGAGKPGALDSETALEAA